MKIVKSAKRYTETALDEVKLLEKIASGDTSLLGRENVIELYDNFKIYGINGSRIFPLNNSTFVCSTIPWHRQDVCMVFEVLGDTLLKLIIQRKYKGLPIDTVKSITAQVTEFLIFSVLFSLVCIRFCVDLITCTPTAVSSTLTWNRKTFWLPLATGRSGNLHLKWLHHHQRVGVIQ